MAYGTDKDNPVLGLRAICSFLRMRDGKSRLEGGHGVEGDKSLELQRSCERQMHEF